MDKFRVMLDVNIMGAVLVSTVEVPPALPH
jgi:hypothetical protein